MNPWISEFVGVAQREDLRRVAARARPSRLHHLPYANGSGPVAAPPAPPAAAGRAHAATSAARAALGAALIRAGNRLAGPGLAG